MANADVCRHCGKPFEAGEKATNQKYCSSECREYYWNWKRSKGTTRGDLLERKFDGDEIDLTDAQAAYIAGIVDGEGTISIWRTKRRKNKSGYRFTAVVEVYNTDTSVLHFLKKTCGGWIGKKSKKGKNKKACWKWACTQSRISDLLTRLRPYLILKTEQADIVLKFREIMRNAPMRTSVSHDVFEELWKETKALNARGA